MPVIAFREIAERIEAGFASGTLKKDELSWDVTEFLEVPEIAQEYPIMFLRDLSLEAGFDWRAPIVWFEKERKAAQPGATDNPGNAQ